jgi:hypothetical protein
VLSSSSFSVVCTMRRSFEIDSWWFSGSKGPWNISNRASPSLQWATLCSPITPRRRYRDA